MVRTSVDGVSCPGLVTQSPPVAVCNMAATSRIAPTVPWDKGALGFRKESTVGLHGFDPPAGKVHAFFMCASALRHLAGTNPSVIGPVKSQTSFPVRPHQENRLNLDFISACEGGPRLPFRFPPINLTFAGRIVNLGHCKPSGGVGHSDDQAEPQRLLGLRPAGEQTWCGAELRGWHRSQ